MDTVQGTGYCGGALFGDNYCADPYNGVALPQVYLTDAYYNNKFSETATIYSELPGGVPGLYGMDCAGMSQANSNPVYLNGYNCNACPPGCVGNPPRCDCSPIVLDTTGHGFKLTDIAHGVYLRMEPNGPKYAISWTDPTSGNGWLVLPDKNGEVHDFTQLFGTGMPQPKSANPNGFIALAVYDLPSEGGNGNGWIDPGDSIYSKLRVWIDVNQNGEAEPEELHTLDDLWIKRIGLRYHISEKTDQYGNKFRYVSEVLDQSDPKTYDVWLRLDTTKCQQQKNK